MFESTQIIAYMAALGVAAAIPGPGMIALVARSVSLGALAGCAMLLGLILGDLAYLSFAVFGLAILVKSFSFLLVFVKWGAVAYLCYIAWSFWHADTQSLKTTNISQRRDLYAASLSGFTITLGNPKTITFYLALLPVVIDIQNVTLNSWAMVLVLATIFVLLAVGAVFIVSALGVRQLLSSAKTQRIMHRGAACTMLTAAGTMIVREI